MAELATVYVRLLGEGTVVWRPVRAERHGAGYLIVGPPHDQHDEEWEFEIGQLVRCEPRRLTDGEVLVAVAPANETGGPLRRFWFPASQGIGIGVTAESEAVAHRMAQRTLEQYRPGAVLTGVVADVDVRTLDQHHVVPNMRPVVWYGVWFPMT